MSVVEQFDAKEGGFGQDSVGPSPSEVDYINQWGNGLRLGFPFCI
jgi:hypothetical protein